MNILNDCYASYINLDHRKDRDSKMIESLRKAGVKAIRTRGRYPWEFVESDPNHAMMRARTVGAIGCFESQLYVMSQALELDRHAFVMEDDLVFCSDFQDRIEYISKWIKNSNVALSSINEFGETKLTVKPREWDVIWLGGTFHCGGKGPWWHTKNLGRDAELTDDPRMVRTYGSFCTYAYIVNKRSIADISLALRIGMSESIGIDWSFIKLSPLLKTYAFVPGCIKQYDNISDQVPGAERLTEFSRFERLNGTVENSRYWWQDKMEDFDPLTFDWAEARV